MTNKTEEFQFGLATITAIGIKFQDKLYSNAMMIKNQLFHLAQIEGEWQIPVLYMETKPDLLVLLDLSNIAIATAIEVYKIDNPEIRQAYFEAINNLKSQLSHKKNKN
ncbi:hypothetical protein [Paenibacillus cremeus]|uniref:Uncharacterized protein n=1 Tax=Paenibacillus cremeus TaxID=2163881 RepID=A0A559K4K3_9BACL|nr:hypothetical protein [Paenibacillus cremeus]TVY07046.1 hypothetical protein FPZ49_26195 [Paenibacillus cremeus]